MSYKVKVHWEKKENEKFCDNQYSREHVWQFDAGIKLAASSSPHVVPLPLSAEAAVDPEEAFVAALSSCHMLWFLSLAAEENYVVETYEDEAVGILGRNDLSQLAMTKVTLNPRTVFGGERFPSPEKLSELHHAAHLKCFIANSVKTKISIIPQ